MSRVVGESEQKPDCCARPRGSPSFKCNENANEAYLDGGEEEEEEKEVLKNSR